MMSDEAKDYLRKLEALEEQRKRWDERNREITNYQMPDRGNYIALGDDPSLQGEDRHDEIINEASALASRVTIAGMVWGLSSPSSDWFRVGIEDKDLMEYRPVKEWLQYVQEGFKTMLHGSNFYGTLPILYGEEIGFGQGVMWAVEDFDDLVRFRLSTAGEYVLANDERGVVNTFGRRVYIQAKQIVDKFDKDHVSDLIKRASEKTPYEWYQVCHFVERNMKRDPRKIDSQNMPYLSVYFDPQSKELMRKKGFEERPMFCPRWSLIGEEAYGRGIGGMMLGSSMQLQEMEKESLKAIYKTNDPPMVGPPEFTKNVDVSAGAINAVPPRGQLDQLKPLYQINFNIQAVEEKIQQVVDRIGRGYFNDLFLFILNNPNATATEILEKKMEKVILFGPVITRQQDELFNPMFKRLYGIGDRAGFFPPPPPDAQGHKIEIEYISQLAIAQKIAATEGIYNYMAFVRDAFALVPEAVDKFNADEAIDEMAELYGVPPKINRDSDAVAEIRELKAQQVQQEQEAADMMATVQGVKDLSQADLTKRNALTELLEAEGTA